MTPDAPDGKDGVEAASPAAEAGAAPAPIPTGFPEPAAAPDPVKPARPGHVTLATAPPLGSLTVPPLEGDGDAVVITADGTEVDDATAGRAREAARLAGVTLREL